MNDSNMNGSNMNGSNMNGSNMNGSNMNGSNKNDSDMNGSNMNSRKVTNTVRAAVLVLGAMFMGIGIFRGEPVEVLHKAIQICLSCIGIG